MGKELCQDYRLRRLRGRGAFGSVWEAVTPGGDVVALKFLPCEDRSTAAQEIRAIQLVKGLHHPNLIPVDRIWCYRSYVVATMPLADGSLADLLDVYQTDFSSAIVPEHLCPMLMQVAGALDFLNARQHMVDGVRVAIQHCDVKPSNLLLFGETVKLCDFSLSSSTTSPLKLHRRAGTLGYAAPEVFRGRLSDHTDQYALAATYCELRGGRLPFPDSPRQFDAAYNRPAPDLSMLSPAERPIIARALAALPQERWPSCQEMMAQLSRLAGVG
jgi:serine/threonine protein kinase